MPKEIFLYSDFYRFTAEDFGRQINEAEGEAVTVRLYSHGGNPSAGYSILAKMQEHGNVALKVDGAADSMAAFMLCYANGVTALDISTFTFHRAAYHNEDRITDQGRVELDKINSFLRKGLAKKVAESKFIEATGVTYDQLFAMDTRIDVTLSADQAKEIGLIDTITPVTDTMLQAISERTMITASTLAQKLEEKNQPPQPKVKVTATNKPQTDNSKNMDLNKLRSEHPELYREVLALGAAQEKDRAGAWLAFVDVDPEAVAKGIKEGEILSQTVMADFSRKAMSAEALKDIKKDNPEAKTTTDEPDNKDVSETEDDKKISAFLAESRKHRDPRFTPKTAEA